MELKNYMINIENQEEFDFDCLKSNMIMQQYAD